MMKRNFYSIEKADRTYDLTSVRRKCLIVSLAISIRLLLPTFGFAQNESDKIGTHIKHLKSMNAIIRSNAAKALGEIGEGSKEVVDALIAALRNDKNADVRSSAAEALGEIGDRSKEAVKEAVDPLIAALRNDRAVAVRRAAAFNLLTVGEGSKEAVDALIVALRNDRAVAVRRAAAKALGEIGEGSKEVVDALIAALRNDQFIGVHKNAAEALVLISKQWVDSRKTEMLPYLGEIYKTMIERSEMEPSDKIESFNQVYIKKLSDEIRRAKEYLESFWWVNLRQNIRQWFLEHPFISSSIFAYMILLIFLLLVLWLRPLWLLSLSAFLSRYEPKIKTQNIEVNLPLRHLLLISLFHYRHRVLNRWVEKYLDIARRNFADKPTVKQRQTFVPLPTIFDEQINDSILPVHLQSTFNETKFTLLFTAEGGAGKTTLACQLAKWAMANEPEQRPCKSHRMLPVLIEGNIELREDGKDAFIEIIGGQIRELIGEAEPIPEELLLKLLRKRRVLVIVDSFSELDGSTRKGVRPAETNFPVAALIVTSRIEEHLGGAVRKIIKPLRLESNKLSQFINDYLSQRGKRGLFTDKEYFDGCSNLSEMIGERDVTALIARMYAEQMIITKENPLRSDMPRNLPDLMLGSVKSINEQVKSDRKETRAVQDVAKIVAWECLRKTFRPEPAKLDSVLESLSEVADGTHLLEYLKNRLQLIQTTGVSDDLIRFSLDPLAEYLAALYQVEKCSGNERDWRYNIFDPVLSLIDGKEQLEASEAVKGIRGFLRALHDCCENKEKEYNVPNSVIENISKLLSSTT